MAKRKKKNRRVLRKLAVLVLAVVAAGVTHWYQQQTAISLDEVPPYSGSPYVVINGNVPDFSAEELSAEPFEVYSPLDFLGRCGTACANVGGAEGVYEKGSLYELEVAVLTAVYPRDVSNE